VRVSHTTCRGQHPQFISSIVTALQLEFYAPGDIVVRQGDMGDAMYFLAQGSLEVGSVSS
jgi:CRP-like cAMP-binding protein